MDTINVYGSDGQTIESTNLSESAVYNDPQCQHESVIEVEDNSGMDVIAKQCTNCHMGWLIRKN